MGNMGMAENEYYEKMLRMGQQDTPVDHQDHYLALVEIRDLKGKVSQLERDLEVAQSMDMTATAEQWEAACKQARREADQLRAAARDFMSSQISRDARWQQEAYERLAALAGVQANEKEEGR